MKNQPEHSERPDPSQRKKTSFKRLRMSKKFILNGSHGNKKQTKETKKGDKFDDTSQNLQKK